MGTNYHLKAPACTCCGRSDADHHLGKSSGGWTFGFHGNRNPENGPLVRNLQEWTEHIREKLDAGWTLESEYGTPTTFEELLDLVESKKREDLNHTIYCRERYGMDASYCSQIWLDEEGNSFSEADFS